MAASLLAAESGPTAIPVEFVQTSCNQPESYHVAPSTPQKSTTNVTIAYTTQQDQQAAGATAKTDSLRIGQNLHHSVTGVARVQSIGSGNTSQQHSVGASDGDKPCITQILASCNLLQFVLGLRKM